MAHRDKQKKSHLDREDLAGEHAVGDAGQFTLACLFLVTWVADTFFFKYTTCLNQYVPIGVRIPLGIAVLVLAGYLAKTGMAMVFGEERDSPVMVTEGVFSVIRHPIYLGELLLYVGLLVWSISLAAAVVWVLAIGFLHYISRHEESLMLGIFGQEYERYMHQVPMWLPRLRKRSSEV